VAELIVGLVVLVAMPADAYVGAKLTPSERSVNDFFGRSVSVSGDTVLVGAEGAKDLGEGSGAAYIFVQTGATWSEPVKLLARDGAPGDFFGSSVSINGETALIGAWGSGAAYVFIRTGATWSQQAKLTARDGESGGFGLSVSVSGDTAVIGAPFDDDLGFFSGSAYVFVRTSLTWSEQAKLVASDGAPIDTFGTSVSLDRDTVVIGAPWDDDRGQSSGSAYVFVRAGATWTEQAKLTASDGVDSAAFGTSVSFHDGTTVIGAPGDIMGCLWCTPEELIGSSPKGSAYVFVGAGATWTKQAKLTASDGAPGDYFGIVSVYENAAVIGAPGPSLIVGTEKGSAYLFVRNGAGWWERAEFSGDASASDSFGLGIATDGSRAVIGTPYDTDYKGSVYVFEFGSGPTPPSAPRNLHATSGDTLVTLRWEPPMFDGDSPISAYRIYRGIATGKESFLILAGDSLTYTDTARANDVAYFYQVSAVNAMGEGPRSKEVSAIPSARDVMKPTLTITSPTAGATLTSTVLTVSGIASDDVAVQNVEVSSDGTNWFPATGTTSWSGTVTTHEGANTISVRATDTSGNVATESVSIRVQVPLTFLGLPVWAPYAVIAAVIAGATVAGILWRSRRVQKRPPLP
jgi:hypothetical protein